MVITFFPSSVREGHVIQFSQFTLAFIAYCERTYFRTAKSSRIKPYVTFSRGHIFTHFVPNSL